MMKTSIKQLLLLGILFSVPQMANASLQLLTGQPMLNLPKEVKNLSAEAKSIVEKNKDSVQSVSLAQEVKAAQDTFCSDLAQTKTNLTEKIATKEKEVNEYLRQLSEKVEVRRNEYDAKLEGVRSLSDQKRGDLYIRLGEKAHSEEEKKAIQKFEEGIEDAVEARREAVNVATQEFRAGVDALAEKRKKSIETNKDAFKTSFEMAFLNAERNCEKDWSTAVLRSAFAQNLKTAREKVMKDEQNAHETGVVVKALALKRQAAMKTAQDTFQATVTKLRMELKQTLGE